MYLDSISFRAVQELPGGFPFELPVIETLEQLNFKSNVTIFVGENGSGKSTLLEAIAVGMKCPTMGASDAVSDTSLENARQLAAQFRFARTAQPRQKMFFRAEDAIGFVRRIEQDMQDLDGMADHFEDTLDGYAQTLAKGVVLGQKAAYASRYGDEPDAKSHGEWFLQSLQSRLHPNGLYLLDEPETPLSPIRQLSLLSLMLEQVKNGCQFIIATHSPILMACPGAEILNFEHRIEPIDWQDVEHVEITKAFLNDPASFLRHL